MLSKKMIFGALVLLCFGLGLSVLRASTLSRDANAMIAKSVIGVSGSAIGLFLPKAYAYTELGCNEVCEDTDGCACQCGSRNDPSFSMQVGDVCEDN